MKLRAGAAESSGAGDLLLRLACAGAAALALLLLVAIAYRLLEGATPAIDRFGLSFLTSEVWEPNFERLGAATFLYGTAVTSTLAMAIALPLGVAIGLFLATAAGPRLRALLSPPIEMLAAIPSVILGFWGILVLGPFLRAKVEPALHDALGFLPIFGAPASTGASLFTAGLLLAIMVVPIIAALGRDLFLAVPQELVEGAYALGATRWEVVRGVILPACSSGLIAASFLGLGRALGEAIATFQVIGAGNFIHASLFATGDTLASRIAGQVQGAPFRLQHAALFYLGAILLAIGLLANLASRLISGRMALRSAPVR
ncbi:MAG TPA: phosphate ABC transporter permease subunit PstC [Solirubrobacteraceae bacterium]|nr:phosphate ABC transporter permease subunit PstC [Solirubrobacteraceae bacterium]